MSLRAFFLLYSTLFILTACGSDDPVVPDETPVSTTSGSMATLSTGDSTYAFIPKSFDIIAVPVTSLGTPLSSLDTQTVTLSNVANSCTSDPELLKVVCVGYANSFVSILDVADFLDTGGDITFTEFDSGVTEVESFSGGECRNCGVIADPGDARFILSSADGYRVYDYDGIQLASYLTDELASPVVNLATENFGFDPVNNLIYSPEYWYANYHLWVINIDSENVYRWENRMVTTTDDSIAGLVGLSFSYSGFTADAVAIDVSTGMVVIGDEWMPRLVTINMHDAVFNDVDGTFSAPYEVAELENVYTSSNWLTTGVAIESGNHLLFMEEEFNSDIAVAQMPTSTMSGGFQITDYNSTQIPAPTETCPGVYSWTNIGDPHGLAVFTAIVDGKSWGLLINSAKTCAAVVDMQGILDAPKIAGTNQVDNSYDLVTNNLVSFVSLQ